MGGARAKSKEPKPSVADDRVAKLELEVAALREQLEAAKRKHAAELEAARARNPPPAAPPAEIANLPAPPGDPLAAQVYAYQVMMLSLHDAAKDTTISARERRKELRTIAASAAKLMPRARLHQAEQLVLNDRAELQKKARDRRGAKLEKMPGGQEPKP